MMFAVIALAAVATFADIHSEYGIRNKIVRTTTDNGSNFLQAFQVFGEDKNNDVSDAEEAEEEDEKENEMGEEVEFFEVTSILNENDVLVISSTWCLQLMLKKQQPTMDTKNCIIQHSASVMGCELSVKILSSS